MKPEFEKIEQKSANSFVSKIVKREQRPLLTQAWHYHPEIEICYTLKSHGLRYVGNNISEYDQGDLVILGSYLPHGFTTIDQSEQYVIQFNQAFLGKDFFDASELEDINSFLRQSNKGIVLKGSELKKAEEYIRLLFMPNLSKMGRLIHLLELLNFLSHCSNIEFICSEKYSSTLTQSKLNKINTIFEFIKNNYQQDISICSASKEVNMTESTFYKFIKRHTNKKFTTILNEYRINHASKLLVSSHIPISEISFKSGYKNLSYFNRVFKNTYNLTPKQFRNTFQSYLEK